MTRRPTSEIVRSRDGQLERHCIRCGEWKPREAFSRCGIRWRYRCRDCVKAHTRARRGRTIHVPG